MELTQADPKGLIRESYAIEGILASECRSIYLDWALSLPVGADIAAPTQVLLQTYGAQNPGHPMNDVLTAGLTAPAAPRRRGGRMGRLSEG